MAALVLGSLGVYAIAGDTPERLVRSELVSATLVQTGPVNGGGVPARVVSQPSFLEPDFPPWAPTCEEAWETAEAGVVPLDPAAMAFQVFELALISHATEPVVVGTGTVEVEVLDINQFWGPVIQCGITPPIEDGNLPTWGGATLHLGNPPVRQTATLTLEGDPPESPYSHLLFPGETVRAHLFVVASNHDPGLYEEGDNLDLNELYENRTAAKLRVLVTIGVRDYRRQQEIQAASDVITVVGLGFPQRWGYEPCENESRGHFLNGQTRACPAA